MGLSASQARLLSLTQRINNNELESEIISNSKIQLASRNTIAGEKYINALDGTKLEYISYDDSGTQEKVSLTFNSINQYTPLKNQYALFNNENQIYVSATDAANFEKSNNLYEFLDEYGLFDQGRDEFNKLMDEYNKELDEYNKDKASKELSTSGKKCDGEDDLDAGGKVNKLAEAIASGNQAQIEKWTLQSDYIANGDGTYSLKTLKQKAIDLAYMLQKGLLSTIPDPTTGKSEMWYSLVNFTDGDMKKLTSTPPIEPVKPTIEEPVMDLAAPQPPEMPEYTDKIYDKPLAQWYTNLWYIMDGNSTSDEIYSIQDEQAEFDYFTVPNVPKTSTPDNNNYIIMPEEQAGNADWLQFAINNGLVRLSQATLKNDTNSTNIRWEGTEYSSTSDIYESQDETKIAKAEAEYQKTLTEIQAEDKQLEKH